MTWKEFKDTVDKYLKENDISENTDIWYIDISMPEFFENVSIDIDELCGIKIY